MAGQASSMSRKTAKPLPPFPGRQMIVLAMCRICEPIAFMSIFPYIYFMIEDFGIAKDANQISFYAGMVTSAFTLAEFSTGMLWGRLSDKIGRKPVLLTGLAGTAVSVLMFGFAPNLWVALLARALGGLLNGNIGVLQSTVAELITVKEHQPRAYTIMPLVWCLGSIIGPLMGGVLARPCRNYPAIFPSETIWARFPYLLPNLVSAATVFCGVVIGLLFLEETHVDKKHRRDPGIELGKRLTACFTRQSDMSAVQDEETERLLDNDEILPKYHSTASSPLLKPMKSADIEAQPAMTTLARDHKTIDPSEATATAGLQGRKQKAFTKPVIINILSYGILAFHTMTFDQLFPVFLSTQPPHESRQWLLPFKFVGGFHLEQTEIAVILSVQGIYQLIATTTFCPYVIRRFGALKLFKMLAVSYFILYILTPYLVLLPEQYTGFNMRLFGIYAAVIWRCTFSSVLYPTNAILLTNSAPTPQTLGIINGAAASTASLCRAFSPTLSGFLYALGLSSGFSGLAWWCNALVAIIGAIISLRVTEPRGRLDLEAEKDDEEAEVVALSDETPGGRPSLEV